MPFDHELLRAARRAGERAAERQCEADVAKTEYHHAIRRLQLSGATMREIAAALNLSHQRVQQIVDGQGGGRRWRRRTPDTPEMLVCSFCGADQRQANKLVAGPGVYICQRCIQDAREIAHGGQPATPAARLVAVGRRYATLCGFCGKDRTKVKHLIMTEADHAPVPRRAKYGLVSICNECLDLCADIIAQPHQS